MFPGRAGGGYAHDGTQRVSLFDGSPARLSRFTFVSRPAVFWAAMWSLLAITEFVALMPVLFSWSRSRRGWSSTGRSAARSPPAAWSPGGVAGHPRRMLMTATGFGLFVWRVLGQVDSPTVLIVADLFEDAWGIPMITLLLAFLTGGRLERRRDRLLVGAFVLELVLEFAVHAFYELPGNFLLLTPNQDLALALDTARQWLVSGACLAVALVVFTRWRAASGPRRRAMLPSVAGIVCLLLFALLQLARTELILWLAVSSLFVVPAAFLAGLLRSGSPAAASPTSCTTCARPPASSSSRRWPARSATPRCGSCPRGAPPSNPDPVSCAWNPTAACSPPCLRPLAGRGSRARARRRRRGGDRAGERGPRQRAAGFARADRHRRRRRAAAARAQPPRRRAAAARRHRPPTPACSATASATIRPRSRSSARSAKSSRTRWPSCASSRAASTPPCSTTASTARWSR